MALIKALRIVGGVTQEQDVTDTIQFGAVGLGTAPLAGNLVTSAGFVVTSAGDVTKINNVATSFPAVQGAAGTVLTNDGAGTLSWVTPAGTIGGTIAANEVAFGTGVDSIGGDARLTWNPGTGVFEVTDVASLPFVTADSTALTLTVANGAVPTTNVLSSGDVTISDGAAAAVTLGVNPGVATIDSTALGAGALNLAVGELQINAAPGTSGQVLTSQGAGAAPTWTTPSTYSLAIGSSIGGSAATRVLYVDGSNALANAANFQITSSSTTQWTGTLRGDDASVSSVFLYTVGGVGGSVGFFDTTANANGAFVNLDGSNNFRLIRRSSSADTPALFVNTSNGNIAVGNNTSPASLFNVGSSNEFQVDSSGDLTKVRNVTYSFPSSQGSASTVLTNNGSGTLSWSAIPSIYSANSVASASSVTIPKATLVTVTGSTTINTFATATWSAGERVTLLFSGAPLVKNTAAKLAGSVDFQTAADSILDLIFDGTTWQEVARKVA